MLRRRRKAWHLAHVALICSVASVAASVMHAQSVSETKVKAAYFYNFAKFIEWPSEILATDTSPIRLCVLKDNSFEEELNQIIKNKTIASHPVDVLSVRDGEQFRSCHMLYVGSSEGKRARQVVELLRDVAVLTVGESEDFLQYGGVIRFCREEDRVRFEVNQEAAEHAHLKISARLLLLAKNVVGKRADR